MINLPLATVSPLMKFVAVIWVFTAIALILIILIQKGKGGGLTSAFGAGMGAGLLGTKTGDFLTWVTITLAVLFLFLAVVMGKFYRPELSQDMKEPAGIKNKLTDDSADTGAPVQDEGSLPETEAQAKPAPEPEAQDRAEVSESEE